MHVPGSHGVSLLKAKAAGADIRMVYSTLDAVRLAEAEAAREAGSSAAAPNADFARPFTGYFAPDGPG